MGIFQTRPLRSLAISIARPPKLSSIGTSRAYHGAEAVREPEQQLAIGPLRSKNPAWTGRHYENRQTRQTDKE